MVENKLPVITLRGDAHSRGRAHGAAFSSAIQQSYGKLRRSVSEPVWQRAATRAAHSWQQLLATAPDVMSELEGIAVASGLAPLNVYLLSGFEFFEEPAPSGCTTVAIATSAGAMVAQNWDALPGTERELALILHEDEERSFWMMTSPGSLGWVGMNKQGLAFVTNDLMLDTAVEGLPSMVVRRLLLKARSTSEAMQLLRRFDHLSGRCYLFGDAVGHVSGAEVSPLIGALSLEGDRIVHTNHPVLPSIAMMEDIEAVARVYPSSRERLRAASRFNPQDSEGIRRILTDMRGTPDAICKSASVREPTQTAFSVVFECSRRRASVCLGRPSVDAYQSFDFALDAMA